MTTPHYSMAHFPNHLDVWAKSMAAALIKRFRGTESYPVLCYRGLSGITAATALMLALNRAKNGIDYTMLYVRKFDEKSNSSNLIELYDHSSANVSPLQTQPVFVVVDDFVSSGNTVAELARGFAEMFKNNFRNQPFQITNDALLCLTGSSFRFVNKLDEYKRSSYMNPCIAGESTIGISAIWNRGRINDYLIWATSKGRKYCKRNSYHAYCKLHGLA